jgi:hypothetical protein
LLLLLLLEVKTCQHQQAYCDFPSSLQFLLLLSFLLFLVEVAVVLVFDGYQLEVEQNSVHY